MRKGALAYTILVTGQEHRLIRDAVVEILPPRVTLAFVGVDGDVGLRHIDTRSSSKHRVGWRHGFVNVRR